MVDLSDRAALIKNLTLLYWIIRASVPLLAFAASRSEGDLADYYRKHMAEEADHDAWLAEDLASADVPVGKPQYAAAAFAGAIYYYIDLVSPAALLGYMWALEGEPLSLAYVEKLEKFHGKPLLRTIRHHAVLDLEHRQELTSQIMARPEKESALIGHVRYQTIVHWQRLVATC